MVHDVLTSMSGGSCRLLGGAPLSPSTGLSRRPAQTRSQDGPRAAKELAEQPSLRPPITAFLLQFSERKLRGLSCVKGMKISTLSPDCGSHNAAIQRRRHTEIGGISGCFFAIYTEVTKCSQLPLNQCKLFQPQDPKISPPA